MLHHTSLTALLLPALLAAASACGSIESSSSDAGPTIDANAGNDAAVVPPVCESEADCDDGLFCNGTESCDPGGAAANSFGCVGGEAPCGLGELCTEDDGGSCQNQCDLKPDLDEDSFDAIICGGSDCNDTTAASNPAALEVCDAARLDEDCNPLTFGDTDDDQDGFVSAACCNPDQANGFNCGTDCDDTVANFVLGDWAHCGQCGTSCAVQEACEADACLSARRVFITSTRQNGNLGGLTGADAICQGLADGVNLGGEFKAYMVDGNTGLDRLERADVPYVRLDGVRIADSFADLVDESIQATLNIDENRNVSGGNVWTGLKNVGGGADGNECGNWTFGAGGCLDGSPCGAAGESGNIDNHWDGFFIFQCSSNNRLYCIEQ